MPKRPYSSTMSHDDAVAGTENPLNGIYWTKYNILLPILLVGATDLDTRLSNVCFDLIELVGMCYGRPRV